MAFRADLLWQTFDSVIAGETHLVRLSSMERCYALAGLFFSPSIPRRIAVL
jgi:hypothetical protein